MSHDLYTEQKGLSYEEALFEAQRCLNCRHKPCMEGCIAHNDIPAMIMAFIEGKGEEAKAISESKTSFPEICGRVCYQEMQCEAVCVRMKQNAPVKIGLIERFIGDHYQSNAKIQAKTQYKVAIVGSGPASLACAQYLLENGVFVELFEKSSKLGGVLTHGIPPYRLPNHVVDKRLQHLVGLGLKYNLDTLISTQNDYDRLLKNQYDSVFLGIGASLVNDAKIVGYENDKVMGWKAFLNLLNLGYETFHLHFSHLESIVVMGGGNVAMDVAITAQKFGIQTHLVYRRGIKQMPARSSEIKKAIQLGVTIHEFTDPFEICDLNGDEIDIYAYQTELVEEGTDHKPTLVTTNIVKKLNANLFVSAIGSKVKALNFKGLLKDEFNQIIVDEQYETTLKNVFAAGDGVTGPKTVIHALAAGNLAAKHILERLLNAE